MTGSGKLARKMEAGCGRARMVIPIWVNGKTEKYKALEFLLLNKETDTKVNLKIQ